MLLATQLTAFLAFQKVRGDTVNTQKSYTKALRLFERWLRGKEGAAPEDGQFTEDNLLEHLVFAEECGTRPRTRYQKVSAFRSFGDWLVARHTIAENPARRIPYPKLDDPVRLLMSAEEVSGLLAASAKLSDPHQQALCVAVLVTFLTTGIRRSELLGLKMHHLEISERRLVVENGKGKRTRYQPLNAAAIQALCHWLKVREAVVARFRSRHPGQPEPDDLFRRPDGNPFSTHSLDTLLNTVKREAGFAGRKNMNPHSQRYFFTDMLVEEFTDIKTIQELLGHKNVQTTLLYIRTNESRKRRAVEGIRLPMPETKPEPSGHE